MKKNIFYENIKNVMNNDTTYTEPVGIDNNNYEDTPNTFLKNYFNNRYHGITPEGENDHPVLSELPTHTLNKLSNELREYIYETLDDYILDTHITKYDENGTPLEWVDTYSSWMLLLNVIHHFKNNYEMQGLINAWMINK